MAHVIKKYILVTKPCVVLCNLISTAGGFFLAAKGEIDPGLMLATIVGTSLAVASGCVCNNCVDRKLDRSMARTQNRVMPKRLMSPTVAICYATLLGISGAVLLTAATGILCLAIVLAGFSIYVGLYSMILKRQSIYSTLVGSLAGAAPPLAGYCAVTQRFDAGAFILVLIFSLWQLPHAYAIGIFRINDYAAAAIPILPVKLGIRTAKVRIVGYILAFTTAASLLTVVGYTGIYYLTAAAVVGLSWLCVAWSGFTVSDDRLWAKSLFILSIVSITLLSIMMAVDVTMPPRNLNHPPEQGIESARSFASPHHGALSRTMTLVAKPPAPQYPFYAAGCVVLDNGRKAITPSRVIKRSMRHATTNSIAQPLAVDRHLQMGIQQQEVEQKLIFFISPPPLVEGPKRFYLYQGF